MDIYIKYDKTVTKLPVLPSSFEVVTKQNNTTVNVVSIGEINLMGKRGLKTITFSSFFPKSSVRSGYQTRQSFKEPFVLCNSLESAKNSGKICRVIITQTNVNFEALIDEFKYGIQDGSGDIEYSISFSEYRRPKITVKTGGVTTLSTNRDYKEPEKIYTVKAKDSLKSIAKKQLGSSKKFEELAKLNYISPPYKVKPGQVILLS